MQKSCAFASASSYCCCQCCRIRFCFELLLLAVVAIIVVVVVVLKLLCCVVLNFFAKSPWLSTLLDSQLSLYYLLFSSWVNLTLRSYSVRRKLLRTTKQYIWSYKQCLRYSTFNLYSSSSYFSSAPVLTFAVSRPAYRIRTKRAFWVSLMQIAFRH